MKRSYFSPSIDITSLETSMMFAQSGGNENFIFKPGVYDWAEDEDDLKRH